MSVCAGMKPSQGLCTQGQRGQPKFLSFFRTVSAVHCKQERSVALIFLIQNVGHLLKLLNEGLVDPFHPIEMIAKMITRLLMSRTPQR